MIIMINVDYAVHWLYNACTLAVHWLYIGCTLAVHWLYIGCTLAVQWLYIGCTMAVHWLYIGCTMAVHWLYNGCTLAVHWLYNGCTMAVHWLYNGCTLAVQWLYIGCTMAVHWPYNGCTLVVHGQRLVRAWIVSRPHNSRPWRDADVTADCVVSKRCASNGARDGFSWGDAEVVLRGQTEYHWKLEGDILGLGGEEVTGDWRKLRDGELHDLFSWPNSYHVRDVRGTEMDAACGAERGEEKWVRGFVGSAWRNGITWKTSL